MPAADLFRGQTAGLDSPATRAFAITPSDTLDLAFMPRALHARGAGTLRVTMAGDGAVVDFYIAQGDRLPLRVSRVWASGTTATGLVGLH